MPDSESERDTVSSQDHLDTRAQLRMLLDRGQAALQEGKRERAQRYFEAALALEKDNEQAWLGLAQLSEDRSLSRAICERLLSINPDFQPARELLAALEVWPTPQERKAPLGSIPVPRQPQPQEPSPALAAEESAETQLGQPADENGAALFVPPWEVSTPIPVWGTQPSAVSSDQAVTHIAKPSGNSAPHDHTVEIEERAAPSDVRPESPAPIIPDSEPAVPDRIPVISGVLRRADDASTTEEAQAITMPTEPNEPTPSLGTPAPFTPLAEDADSATPIPSRSKVEGKRLLQNIAMFMMLGLIILGSGLIVFLARNEARAAQLRRMILGAATQSAPPAPTLTQIRLPSPTPIPSPTPMPTPMPSPSPLAAATADNPGASPASDETVERFLQPVEGKWIEIDLSEQVLIAYEGTNIVFKTRISSGRSRTPTVTGQFRIQRKYESQTMTGPGYYLPAVPYVMYFFQGYSLHGTYWHNNWGVPMSHGCINLSKSDAKWLYEWTEPVVPAGSKAAFATAENPGTWVVIHE